MYNAPLVVEMIISGRIVEETISAPDIGQDHTLHMCRAPINTGRNNICVYCGSTHHTSGNCTSWPNDNREEPRSTPQDLHSHEPYDRANTKYSAVPRGNAWSSTNCRPVPAENLGNCIPVGQKVYTNNMNLSFPYRDFRYDQDRTGHQQTRFDERYNRQYSPNYNYNHYQPSPSVSVAGPDISTTLINLAKYPVQIPWPHGGKPEKPRRCVQWADQGQQRQSKWHYVHCYQHLWGVIREIFEEWIDELDQACRISECDFRDWNHQENP